MADDSGIARPYADAVFELAGIRDERLVEGFAEDRFDQGQQDFRIGL